MGFMVLTIALLTNVVLVLLVTAGLIRVRNRLARLRNNIEASWAQIEVQLARRHALIPNLVATVRGAAGHERQAIDAVTAAHRAAAAVHDPRGSAAPEALLDRVLHRMLDLAGRDPGLGANDNYLALQDELAVTEDKIAYARQFYNLAVQRYNDAVRSFPASLMAGRHREPYPYFELDDAAEHKVQVRFEPRPRSGVDRSRRARHRR
jgi:LemA protein